MSVRNKKTNKAQMEVLLNFLEQNRVLVTGKTHPMNPGELDAKWEELTSLLNSMEHGARKDKKQWKTYLYEWKSKTKRKARLNNNAIMQTGGGGYICKDLNDLENRLMAIFRWINIIGCPGAPAEVDPDAELPQNVMIEEIEIQIENESQVSELHETDVPSEICEPAIIDISRDLPSKKGAVPTNSQQKKKKKIITSSTKLENSAILYSQSTEQMAIAVKEMAAAISQLAVAISNIATALNKDSEM